MRWLINYFRHCFCKHDFKLIGVAELCEAELPDSPYGIRKTYFCRKCGYVRRVRL